MNKYFQNFREDRVVRVSSLDLTLSNAPLAVLQHSGCIVYYWLFYVPAIHLYSTACSPTTLFLR